MEGPRNRQYGLKQFQTSPGEYSHYMLIDDEVKPPLIDRNGTKIVLMGMSASEDTMQPPTPETPSPSRWVSKYLNTRYFSIPKGITIKAREGWQNPLSDKDRNVLRRVVGQDAYLKEHSIAKGRVKLSDAVAHWWILKDEPAITNNSGFIESAGHMASLYQDELYELTAGRSGTARLQNFGVVFGHRFVVIYVEPKPAADKRLTTNTARTMLLINNEALPWTDWAAEFRENMPPEIADLIAEKAAASTTSDHGKSIRERLKPFLDLFKVSRYKTRGRRDRCSLMSRTLSGVVSLSARQTKPTLAPADRAGVTAELQVAYTLSSKRKEESQGNELILTFSQTYGGSA